MQHLSKAVWPELKEIDLSIYFANKAITISVYAQFLNRARLIGRQLKQ